MRDADADPRSTSRPLELVGTLESINRAERLIKDVIAEAGFCSASILFHFHNLLCSCSSALRSDLKLIVCC